METAKNRNADLQLLVQPDQLDARDSGAGEKNEIAEIETKFPPAGCI
jgi:hypothetical protein